MIDPLVLTLCPDGHLDGPRQRVIVPREAIAQVRELEADPADPELARCEVEIVPRTEIAPGKWVAVEDSFDEIAYLLDADRLVEVRP